MGDMRKNEGIDDYLYRLDIYGKSVSIWLPSIRETGTSKKLTDFCDHTAVNFIVG